MNCRSRGVIAAGSLALCLASVLGCDLGSDPGAAEEERGRPKDEACVVALTNTFAVTVGDVARVRRAVFPPPGWDESTRLAVVAALAYSMLQGQPVEDSDSIGVSKDPWLAAYGRLTRITKLDRAGAPDRIAAKLDEQLRVRWNELGGKPGPCGAPLDALGWR